MNTHQPAQPSKPLRLLDALLRGLRIVLIAVSVLAVPLMVVAATGRGTISVNGAIDARFAVEFDDGTRIGVNGESLSYENFEIGREHHTLAGAPTVAAAVDIERDDLDSRLIVIGMASVWLVASWVGLVSFRGIVTSALRGEWLPGENPTRLRRLGGAILAYAATGLVGQWLLRSTLDTVLPFQVSVLTATWLTTLLVGVAVLALAEPFAEAARLREFEASTI